MAYLNADLIGVPGGRAQLQTPALVIDLDHFERNIAAMAEHCARQGLALRPHAKTHKSLTVARRQIAAGAIGQCAAKLGEAEALADGGIESILITSPVVTEGGMRRLAALNARVPELIAVCDHGGVVDRLAAAFAHAEKPLKLLVDLDVGLARTGIESGARAAALAKMIAHAPGLAFAGLQAYAGHLMHLESPNERRAKSLEAMAALKDMAGRLAVHGLACPILTGGGTGTFDIDPDARVLTDIQCGSYVFMDRQYNDVWEKPGDRAPFATALFVQTTVVSANHKGLATTDAGFKSFATDAGPPAVAQGAPKGASYFFFGDEQGGVIYDADEHALAPGDVIACVVPHCDPTVNLYDCYHVCRGDMLVDIWPIEARSRSA